MIQPAAVPAVPGLLVLGEASPAQAGDGPEAADFGALLAVESQGFAPPGLMPMLPPATLPTLPVPVADAATLPESGKPLPVAPSEETSAPEPQHLSPPANPAIGPPYPLQAAGDTASRGDAAQAAPAETTLRLAVRPALEAVPTRPLHTARPVLVLEPARKLESGDCDEPVPAEPLATALIARTLAVPTQAPEPALSTARLEAAEMPSPALPRQAPAALGQAERTLPALLAQLDPDNPQRPAQTPVTLSAMTVAVAPALQIGKPQPRLTFSETEPLQVPEGAEPLAVYPRHALPAAITAEQPRTPGKIAPTAVADLAAAEPITPSAALAAPAALTLPALPAFAPIDPALRPHDFTQLVDRLVAARELVQPQGFQLAVRHGEFGPVQLRFQREGDSLNVTMASADPDFARVVSAAPAPVLPALPVETPAQSGPRSDSQAQTAASNGGSAHNRGASSERREDRHGHADNPAHARQGEGRGSRRSGIFA